MTGGPGARLGLVLDPLGDPVSIPEQARAAEAAGFDLLASGEHVMFHGPVGNAFVTLAAAAAVTERAGLLSALTLLPLYPIGLAARLAADLDRVSGGRFMLGAGVGGEYPPEFAACGADVTRRGAKADEALAVLRELLRGGTVTRRGEFASFDRARLQPGPARRPVPVWIGGRKAAAQRRAARFGDGWLPYLVTPAMLAAGLEAIRGLAPQYGRDPAGIDGGVFAWGCVHASAAAARDEAVRTVSAVYQQDFAPLADRYLVAGDPESVAARLREYAAAGARLILFAPACAPQRRAEMTALLAREVLPALR